uniref:type II secretion system F family protein n=1 Tax=uncultured Allobacillus sp. TaxID=1638025 RepID=UPI0025929E42|nr:type II secretion system F family protein [uncultured Allobacillus sp.]
MQKGLFKSNQKRKLNLTTQVTFLNRMARLLERDHSMKQALEFLTYDPQLGQLAKQFVHQLENGTSLKDCFKLYDFQPIVVSFLFFSNESGNLSEHLIHLNRLLTMRLEFQTKLKKLLRYPLFLLAVCIILLIALNTFLLPMFERSFRSMGTVGSLPTYQLILQVTQTLFLVFLIGIVITALLLYRFHRQSTVEQKVTMYEKTPLLHGVFKMLITAQLSYQLASLLQSGKTIKEAILIIQQQDYMPSIQYFASLLTDHLQTGMSLYSAFKDLPLIESEFKLMIKRSTEQGTLAKDLQNYTNLAIDSIEDKLKSVMMIIQPIVYVVLGLMIVLIYSFTLFPMFQMINQL